MNATDLRWLLQGLLSTTSADLAEHRGFARATLATMGRKRGRKPKAGTKQGGTKKR